MSEPKKIAVILAGGRSSRFGSDKLFALIDGKPMLERVIQVLKQGCFEIFLSGSYSKLASFNLPVLEDENPFEGPLSALSSVLSIISQGKILLVAGDMPFLSQELLSYLWQVGQTADLVLIEHEFGIAPLPGIYSSQLRTSVNDLLNAGRRDLKALISEKHLVKILSEKRLQEMGIEQRCFRNINSQEDIKE